MESHEVCIEHLNNLEDRELECREEILFGIDGGKGHIKELKEKICKGLTYKRCVIHKDRNIQKHLPKKY